MAQGHELSKFFQSWILLLDDFTLYMGDVAQMMTISGIFL